jgi:hypothetical protein
MKQSPWLFSGPLDIAIFGGSALLSFVALWIGSWFGVLHSETPDWTWIPAVLLVDVAHVYSTAFRIYLDPEERRRRPVLYTVVPLVALLIGVFLYWKGGPFWFWRIMAYAAVYHFVRQQYGFLILYRARLGETDKFGYWLDTLTIYAATLYPLIYWHAHLPRQFTWFAAGDFFSIPVWVSDIAAVLYWSLLFLYGGRALLKYSRTLPHSLAPLRHAVEGRHPESERTRATLRHSREVGNPEIEPTLPAYGKDLLVLTTVLCWYIGIITFNSDYAFTVTNVLIHGIPYLALIFWYGKKQPPSVGSIARSVFVRGPLFFLLLLWVGAYFEEMIWDRAIWHDRDWFFGDPWEVGALEILLVPLLALPQLTHYLLDGFIWKRRQNPGVQKVLTQ